MWALWEAWERVTVEVSALLMQCWGRVTTAMDKMGADARRMEE